MSVTRVCVFLLGFLVALPALAGAQQQDQQRCADAIPVNVEARLFTADVLALLRLSETFRAQCERIAAEPRVRVRISVASTVEGGGRAQTTFHRYRTGTIVADVQVLFAGNYRELLAHEFEHVIEQLDGLDLRQEAAGGRAWEVATGTYETRRAILAGVQVLRESATVHAASLGVLPTR